MAAQYTISSLHSEYDIRVVSQIANLWPSIALILLWSPSCHSKNREEQCSSTAKTDHLLQQSHPMPGLYVHNQEQLLRE